MEGNGGGGVGGGGPGEGDGGGDCNGNCGGGVKLPKSVALFRSDPGTFCGISGQPILLHLIADFSSDLERDGTV